MTYQFKNNAASVLTGGINTTALIVNITPSDAGKYPTPSGDNIFMATLRKATGEREVVKVTNNNGAGAMTIVRAQEGTSPLSFITGDYFEHRLTEGALQSFAQKDGLVQSNLNAQKINSIEASATKAANKLLACDADGDLVVDIKGNALTADTAANSLLLAGNTVAQIIAAALADLQTRVTVDSVIYDSGIFTVNSTNGVVLAEQDSYTMTKTGTVKVVLSAAATGQISVTQTTIARLYKNGVDTGLSITKAANESLSGTNTDTFEVAVVNTDTLELWMEGSVSNGTFALDYSSSMVVSGITY